MTERMEEKGPRHGNEGGQESDHQDQGQSLNSTGGAGEQDNLHYLNVNNGGGADGGDGGAGARYQKYPCGEGVPKNAREVGRWFYFDADETPRFLKIKYHYTDDDGHLVLYKDGKPAKKYPTFHWTPVNHFARPFDGDMRNWTKGTKGLPPILYNLDLLKNAAPEAELEDRIVVTEGEKDAVTVFDVGLGIGTCSILGAVRKDGAGWDASYNRHLVGQDVILCEDNDLAGRIHVNAVGRILKAAGITPRVIRFRAFGKHADDGFDLTDFTEMRLAEGKSYEEIKAELLGMVEEWKYEPTVLSREDHMQSAREFLEWKYMDGEDRLLHRHRSAFWEWDEACYRESNTEAVSSEIWKFLEDAVVIKKEKNDLRALPFNPNKNVVANVLDALKAQSRINDYTEAPAWLKRSGIVPADELFSVGNGLLHLPTRKLYDPTPNFFNLNASQVEYDPSATCPQWEKFLEDVLGDQDAIQLCQEWAGYTLSPDTSQQKIFLAVGPKRSGKGTFGRVIHELLGAASCIGPTMASLGTRFALETWIGKSLATISDARIGARTDKSVIVERLLSISGEDNLTIERKFVQGGWTGKLPTRIMILTNMPPVLTDSASALVGRYVMVRFTKSFYGKEDHGLTGKLKSELPGILNWALDGYDRLMARGHFVQPHASEKKLLELEKLSAPIKAFIDDYCVVGPGKSAPLDQLYAAWAQWCYENGNGKIGSKDWFARDLNTAEPGLETSRIAGVKTYVGIALNETGVSASKWVAPKGDQGPT